MDGAWWRGRRPPRRTQVFAPAGRARRAAEPAWRRGEKPGPCRHGAAGGSFLWKRISAGTGGPRQGEEGVSRSLDPPGPRFVPGGERSWEGKARRLFRGLRRSARPSFLQRAPRSVPCRNGLSTRAGDAHRAGAGGSGTFPAPSRIPSALVWGVSKYPRSGRPHSLKTLIPQFLLTAHVRDL